jgi:hypothetical protein
MSDEQKTQDPHETVHFVVHNAEGRVLRSGDCPRRDLPLQAQAGERLIEAAERHHPDRHVVRDGAIVRLPKGERAPPIAGLPVAFLDD